MTAQRRQNGKIARSRMQDPSRRRRIDREMQGVRLSLRTQTASQKVHDGLYDLLTHLKRTGNIGLWKALSSGDLDALDLYERYLRGELEDVILKESAQTAKSVMLDWAKNRPNETTRKSYREYIEALFKGQETATIDQLPAVLASARSRYEKAGQKNAFGQCRKVASSWAGKTYGKDSALWRKLRALPPLETSSHEHKQEARPVWEVFATVKAMDEPFGKQFLTMCLVGLGTKEFLVDGFAVERNEELGFDYIRVFGKKTEHRNRKVPLIFSVDALHNPTVTYANRARFDRALHKIQKTWQLYDARRTFRHWCDMAGVPDIRAKAYCGRLSATVDERYMRHNIDPYMVEDADKLRAYILANMTKPEPRKDIVEVPALPEF